MEGHRAERIIEALRVELDELIGYEMSDPRVEGVTVTEIVLSPDGKKAVVRISSPGGEVEQKAAVAALEHAKSFLKTELIRRLQMYRAPDLRFEVDVKANATGKLDNLMRRIRRGRPRDGEQQAS